MGKKYICVTKKGYAFGEENANHSKPGETFVVETSDPMGPSKFDLEKVLSGRMTMWTGEIRLKNNIHWDVKEL